MTRRIARKIAPRMERLAARRRPDVVIGDPAAPYLLRWWLIPRNRFLNVYLHRFLRDDDDRALHDHPWASLSLTLAGELDEIWLRRGVRRQRRIVPGAVTFRRARFAHRLSLPGGPALTLFVTGPRIREWGFLCPHGWRHWRDFTAPGAPGENGRGCE